MGFAEKEKDLLGQMARRLHANFKYEYDKDRFGLTEYWEDQSSIPMPVRAPFQGDCEQFAMVAVYEANRLGIAGRLVICLTETGEGHCIAELCSSDGKEAYYMDNRKRGLLVRSQLAGYKFYSASPWNPKRGETRPWHVLKRT